LAAACLVFSAAAALVAASFSLAIFYSSNFFLEISDSALVLAAAAAF